MEEEYFNIIKKSVLFYNFSDDELSDLLNCLESKTRIYKKGEPVFSVGEEIKNIGLILNGLVLITKEDFWGNRAILSKLDEGKVFGETFALLNSERATVNAICEKETKIIFIDVNKALTVCSNACSFHNKLISNFTLLLARKNLNLTSKIEHLSKRTTKEKLLSYLSEVASKKGSSVFEIPFNRQQLADFLCVERSAMSSELSKLKKDGIIDFDKQIFLLKKTND